jgi:hypothetical protein
MKFIPSLAASLALLAPALTAPAARADVIKDIPY